jgi:hypothetical protein
MKMKFYFIACILLFGSCVSKAKYNDVVFNIETRQKQNGKLEKKLDDLKTVNKVLGDSVLRTDTK